MGSPQLALRDTAAEFARVRGALQSAAVLPVVIASPVRRARVDALIKRAATIQQTIEGAGRMIDGARRWFSDTFGVQVEDSVPAANPAIAASIKTSVAAMNYFLRDAKAELDAIIDRQRQYESIPEEKRAGALAELRAAEAPAPGATIAPKWLWLGIGATALFVLLKGGDDES
jgi:hypothetical protein